MGPVSAELAIDVPRRRAFDFIGDLANRPAFTDHFISDFHLSRVASSGVGAGARFRFYAPPQAIWMDTVIEELEPPHRISERGRGGRFNRIPSATEWELTEGSGSLTTVRVVYWTEPSHPIDRAKEVLGAASVWYSRDWQAALRRLRDLLESHPEGGRRVGIAGGNRQPTGIP
jgi:uncharacterized protein YndB with AHSA1/START domain